MKSAKLITFPKVTDTVAILNSVDSNSHYEMLRGPIICLPPKYSIIAM